MQNTVDQHPLINAQPVSKQCLSTTHSFKGFFCIMSDIMEYSFGQCRLAVLVLSPPNSLCPIHTSRTVQEVEMSLVLCSHCSATNGVLLTLFFSQTQNSIIPSMMKEKTLSQLKQGQTARKEVWSLIADIAVAVWSSFSGKKVFMQWAVLAEGFLLCDTGCETGVWLRGAKC